jgi:HK97 family phage prohead protease
MYYKDLRQYQTGDTKHKILSLQETLVKEVKDNSNPDKAGEIQGFAAGLLNIDRGQDIIFPGAFDKDLPDFQANGVVAYQHDWTSVIGKPTLVQEKLAPEYGLYTEADIASTSLGVDVMKLVRMTILKKLSIGYRLKEGGYSVMNRETLLATLRDKAVMQSKIDSILNDFDTRKLSEVFGLFDITLFEYSVVTRPMNDNADITGAKNEGGLLDGLPFSYHPLQVLNAVKGYAERVRNTIETYSKDNRKISQPHISGVKEIRSELEKLLPGLVELENLSVKQITDTPVTVDVNKLLSELAAKEAEFNLHFLGE